MDGVTVSITMDFYYTQIHAHRIKSYVMTVSLATPLPLPTLSSYQTDLLLGLSLDFRRDDWLVFVGESSNSDSCT